MGREQIKTAPVPFLFAPDLFEIAPVPNETDSVSKLQTAAKVRNINQPCKAGRGDVLPFAADKRQQKKRKRKKGGTPISYFLFIIM
ncbi:MAG: hypothetical protein LBQ78_04835 [Tannerellaceae bacterium]|jgi:hypothetical protein|nr:hypothetical protein [Tannerellaceae bacterium]